MTLAPRSDKIFDRNLENMNKLLFLCLFFNCVANTCISAQDMIPFIGKVEVIRDCNPDSTLAEAYGNLYFARFNLYEPQETPPGNVEGKFEKIITEGCWTNGCGLIIHVETMKDLRSLSCKIPQLSATAYVLDNVHGEDHIETSSLFRHRFWAKYINGVDLAPGTYTLEFTGIDYTGDTLSNTASFSSPDNDMNKLSPADPVARTFHSFNITGYCREAAVPGNKDTTGGKKGCPFCHANNLFYFKQERIPGEKGRAIVTLMHPESLIKPSFIWKDSLENIIGAGAQFTLDPGEYKVEIIHNTCCKMNQWLLVPGCEFKRLYGVDIPECPPSALPVELTAHMADNIRVEHIEWSFGAAGQITAPVPAYGKHFVWVRDIYGCEEREEFEIIAPPPFIDRITYTATQVSGDTPAIVKVTLPPEINAEDDWSWYLDIPENEGDDSAWNQLTYYVDTPGAYMLMIIAPDGGCTYAKEITVR